MDRRSFLRAGALGAVVAGASPLVAACSKDDADPPSAQPSCGDSLADVGCGAESGLTVATAQPELIVGTSRFSFGLLAGGRPLPGAQVRLYAGRSPDTRPEVDVEAVWLDEGIVADKAVYVATVPFSMPGDYFVAAVATKDGRTLRGGSRLTIAATSTSPVAGQKAISVSTPTSANPRGSDPLCSRRPAACSMHALSLDTALKAGKPVVVTFSAPAFCTTDICGPVVDIVERVAKARPGKAQFIHVEAYVEKGTKLAAPLVAWKFTTEPWTYVIDAKGVVTERLAGAIGEQELLAAVDRLPA